MVGTYPWKEETGERGVKSLDCYCEKTKMFTIMLTTLFYCFLVYNLLWGSKRHDVSIKTLSAAQNHNNLPTKEYVLDGS